MSHKISKPQRYSELDALRGIAAIAVVLFHFTYGYDNGLNLISNNKFYFKYGYLGVHLFFIISGFVIFMTLEKATNSTSFAISRFSRLFPAYWTAILLTIIITTLLSVPFQKNIYTIKQVLVNFTMLQFWFKIKDVDGAYWTLAVELTFYIIMWLLYITKQLNNIQWICTIWLLLSIIFSSFTLPLQNYINVILILKQAPLFCAGIAFFLIKTKGDTVYLHLLVLASIITELLILSDTTKDLVPHLIIISLFLVFYLFIFEKLKFLSNAVFVFWGSISYSLYLIHENIGFAIIYWLKKLFDNQLFYISVTSIIIIGLAYMITNFIEKPAMSLIRNYHRKNTKID